MKIVGVHKMYIAPQDLERLKKFGEVVIYDDIPNKREYIKRIKDAAIIIDKWHKIPISVMSAAPKLKMIAIASIGYERVDLKEAKRRGIVASNCPAYCSNAVAEHTIGLMLAAARLTSQAENDVRKGIWRPIYYVGKELRGMTLGVIGYGSIGKRIAEIAEKGLNMKILSSTSNTPRHEFEKLLQESDVICMATPLNKKTKGMIGKKEFGMMKNGVIFVNTSRGGVIDEQALIDNLKSGKIFAAGLDVMKDEPMNKDNPLFSFPNVTITPHIAYNTETAQEILSRMVTDNIIAFLKGKPKNVVS